MNEYKHGFYLTEIPLEELVKEGIDKIKEIEGFITLAYCRTTNNKEVVSHYLELIDRALDFETILSILKDNFALYSISHSSDSCFKYDSFFDIVMTNKGKSFTADSKELIGKLGEIDPLVKNILDAATNEDVIEETTYFTADARRHSSYIYAYTPNISKEEIEELNFKIVGFIGENTLYRNTEYLVVTTEEETISIVSNGKSEQYLLSDVFIELSKESVPTISIARNLKTPYISMNYLIDNFEVEGGQDLIKAFYRNEERNKQKGNKIDVPKPRFYITKYGKEAALDQKIGQTPKSKHSIYLREEYKEGSEYMCSYPNTKGDKKYFNIKNNSIIDNPNKLSIGELNEGINILEILTAAERIITRYNKDIEELIEKTNSLKNKAASIDTIKSLTEHNCKVTISKISDKSLIWEIRESLENILFHGDRDEDSIQDVISLLIELTGVEEFKKIDYSDRFKIIKLED